MPINRFYSFNVPNVSYFVSKQKGHVPFVFFLAIFNLSAYVASNSAIGRKWGNDVTERNGGSVTLLSISQFVFSSGRCFARDKFPVYTRKKKTKPEEERCARFKWA